MDPFMQAAYEEALQSKAEGGIPIGSVLVKDGKIIGRGHNRRAQNGDPTAHAEIETLRSAGRVGSYAGAVLYSTLMPCYYCSGAAVQFGIQTVIVGESASLAGGRDFMEAHGIQVTDLDLDECKALMGEFMRANPTLWNEDIGQL